MEGPCSRFTPAEGGARLAATAASKNTLAVEYASFISTRLIYEEAYKIRGSLSGGKQRSVYVTRATMVDVVAYELNILTDLRVTKAHKYEDISDWSSELEKKEVLVCTSCVMRPLLEESLLTMPDINVLVVDSSHLIATDHNLQYIMKCYKECEEDIRPRILALTYPLFSYPKKENTNNGSHEVSENLATSDGQGDSENLPITDHSEILPKVEETDEKLPKSDGNLPNTDENLPKSDENLPKQEDTTTTMVETVDATIADPKSPEKSTSNLKSAVKVEPIGVYENLDDFDMYEKLEWKIEQLEKELCCQMDLAEDIDGGKRLSATLTKPMEVLIEHGGPPDASRLPPEYVELEQYMRGLVDDANEFLERHRYDPTEIYGEDLYEEFMNIPNPVIEPKQIFHQFLYVLDELGPYAADKAAFSLLTKLEKLKIKVPYERHFLLLCLCTTVFVKIRCYADLVFSKYESDWEKIKTFCTPKVLRFAEILEKFCPENNENTKSPQHVKGNQNVENSESISPNEENRSEIKNSSKTNELLEAIERCDFITLSNKIEDKVNTYEANLKELDEINTENKTQQEVTDIVDNPNENQKESLLQENQNNEINNETKFSANDVNNTVNDQNAIKSNPQSPQKTHLDQKGFLGPLKRPTHRNRGRGRTQRANQPRNQQQSQNPDALCGIVFMKEPLMAKIMFMLIVDMSRSNPKLSYLCSQYCCAEQPADRTVPSECQRQNKKQEDVLKKFRMHECNLLLATSALEEGIDLPRCNLVLRWDVPASYRSYGLCRSRARAPRATCALLTRGEDTDTLLHNVAVYRELDQIISRKCGCGIQDEPPQSEEDHADSLTHLVKPYTPSETTHKTSNKDNKNNKASENIDNKITTETSDSKNASDKNESKDNKNSELKTNSDNLISDDKKPNVDTVYPNVNNSMENKKVDKIEDSIASVDLSTAIALINRYCGKLPSDTFTRLAPQWWMEQVQLPVKNTTQTRPAYICTLRLPLNCPVKHNIVGHPMPSRALARRVVALQACRILHRSGELDDQLMPIGKEGFKAAEVDSSGNFDLNEPSDSARPGTTKRRQYYYKRTAWAFTDCQPVVDTTDAEMDQAKVEQIPKSVPSEIVKKPGTKRNMLYAIKSTLWCALPERYNTRGRRLHAPQNASQAIGILMARDQPDNLQIPAFPVYTRSGEVRVSVEYVPDADVRMSPSRGRAVRRFMRFVFAEVLRVRRRGMKLQSEGSTHNNYYIVPTVTTTREDGSTKIDVDWAFLELIYKYTEEKKNSEIERPSIWVNDEEEEAQMSEQAKVEKKSEKSGEVKKMENPLLAPGETFVFDADKYREAVVTPWYRNQDQPQFFLVAEICWNLSPDSAFPSATHTTFREYYRVKYGVQLTQTDQPLLDVDHTSNRLNLLTPRYVNRKGVALPVSSERTRRAKRDRLDQKQILVPELCCVHPFAAPLWSATVCLPCVLYRINALLIADEIRRAVAIDVGLGIPKLDDTTCPGFQWPPLHFGWSLQEVLSADSEKNDKNRTEDGANKKPNEDIKDKEETDSKKQEVEDLSQGDTKEKTINDILQEKECTDSAFEIGTWSNEMASSIPLDDDYDDYMQPLPPNLTFCTSASGGANWCDPIEKPKSQFQPTRKYNMADSDCSYMSSDFDTDDSDLNSDVSEEDDTSGFCSSRNSNVAMGVRIEYKTAHEAEAVDLERKKTNPAPVPDQEDDAQDRRLHEELIRAGDAPTQYIEGFRQAVAKHEKEIVENGLLIKHDQPIVEILPPPAKEPQVKQTGDNLNKNTVDNLSKNDILCAKDNENLDDKKELVGDVKVVNEITNTYHAENDNIDEVKIENDEKLNEVTNHLSKINFKDATAELLNEIFPYGNTDLELIDENGQIRLENIEKNKRLLLAELKKSLPESEINKLNCFSMVDVDIDGPDYVNEKVVNVGFDNIESYKEKVEKWRNPEPYKPYYMEGKIGGGNGKEFDFDFQPDLEGHPGPSPSVILQALTMSNANDGINLERLETIGDSFLKFAITAYLYCAHPTVHEGKLSHMRSKQVSNLNLYRLGRNKRLGARMIASKFEPHDNWLPPCHKPPNTLHPRMNDKDDRSPPNPETPLDDTGCFIPYNLITQHSIPDKSIADCVEALIGAYLLECGVRGALLFMSWLGIRVLPRHDVSLTEDHPYVRAQREQKVHQKPAAASPAPRPDATSDSDSSDCDCCRWHEQQERHEPDWSWPGRPLGSLRPYRDSGGQWRQTIFGELKAPPSPLLRYIADPEGELERMLSGYDALENTLQYRFRDRSLLLQALTHASHQQNRLTDCYQRLEFLGDAILGIWRYKPVRTWRHCLLMNTGTEIRSRDRSLLLQALTHASHQQNRLTDCYQRLEFLGDAILDYLITRHLYEDKRRHSPGALTDLRSALVNNTIFATLAARHGFHKHFRHTSPALNIVLANYVTLQEENSHSISEEHYLIQEDEMEQAEDVEVPKALGDLFESVAGAIFLDSGMSLSAVWRSYVRLMGAELEAFSAAAPKSPVRELLEAEPDTAKFGKPERLADGRRVRVCVEVFGRGAFKGVGRNYRIAKGTAARCALRHLKAHRPR